MEQYADKVFTNGQVITINANNDISEALAVSGNKIVYVGPGAGVKDYIGKKTELVDLKGKNLIPGFIDSH